MFRISRLLARSSERNASHRIPSPNRRNNLLAGLSFRLCANGLATDVYVRKMFQFCGSHRKQHTHALSVLVGEGVVGGGAKEKSSRNGFEGHGRNIRSGGRPKRSCFVGTCKTFRSTTRTVATELVCNSISSATSGVAGDGGRRRWSIARNREKAHLPPSRRENYRI